MNFDVYNNELTIYKGTSVDEDAVVTLARNITGSITVSVEPKYELVKVDGNNTYEIRRKEKW